MRALDLRGVLLDLAPRGRPCGAVMRSSVSSRIRAISAFDQSRMPAMSSSAWLRRSAASVGGAAVDALDVGLGVGVKRSRVSVRARLGGGLHRLGEVGHELVRLLAAGAGGRGGREPGSAVGAPALRSAARRVGLGVGGRRCARRTARSWRRSSSGVSVSWLGGVLARSASAAVTVGRRISVGRRSRSGPRSRGAGIRVSRRSWPCVVDLSVALTCRRSFRGVAASCQRGSVWWSPLEVPAVCAGGTGGRVAGAVDRRCRAHRRWPIAAG